jgi:hypothetical protein
MRFDTAQAHNMLSSSKHGSSSAQAVLFTKVIYDAMIFVLKGKFPLMLSLPAAADEHAARHCACVSFNFAFSRSNALLSVRNPNVYFFLSTLLVSQCMTFLYRLKFIYVVEKQKVATFSHLNLCLFQFPLETHLAKILLFELCVRG